MNRYLDVMNLKNHSKNVFLVLLEETKENSDWTVAVAERCPFGGTKSARE